MTVRRILHLLTAISVFVALPVAQAATAQSATAQSTSTKPSPLTAGLSGSVEGSGSTLANRYYQAIITEMAKSSPNLTIKYRAIGSGKGKGEFGKGITDFAGTDSLVKSTDAPKAAEFLYVPTTAAAVAVAYKLKGVDSLKLSAPTLAKIFQREIKRWDDPTILAENPGVKLPNRVIGVVRRADPSGTTSNFTKFLAVAAPDVWKLGSGDTVAWSSAMARGVGNRGMAQLISYNNGSIGYVEAADATAFGLNRVAIRNKDGEYVLPTPAGVAAALAEVTAEPDLTFQPLNAPGSDSYPITAPTYVLVRTEYKDRQTADAVVAFLTYGLNEGQELAPKLDYAALPEPLRAQALEQLKKVGVATP